MPPLENTALACLEAKERELDEQIIQIGKEISLLKDRMSLLETQKADVRNAILKIKTN